MKVFPAWMYEDPAIAAERLENIELRGEERRRRREEERARESYQLVARPTPFLVMKPIASIDSALPVTKQGRSLLTLRLVKRARIQELVRTALKERK